jgi:hypothetical protein
MSIIVQIPTLPEVSGHIASTIDMSLTPALAVKLEAIRLGLIEAGAEVAGGGRVIQTTAEAIAHLIDAATTP